MSKPGRPVWYGRLADCCIPAVSHVVEAVLLASAVGGVAIGLFTWDAETVPAGLLFAGLAALPSIGLYVLLGEFIPQPVGKHVGFLGSTAAMLLLLGVMGAGSGDTIARQLCLLAMAVLTPSAGAAYALLCLQDRRV